MMKRKVAHSEEECKSFIEKGFTPAGKEENGNYVFFSNDISDVLSEREFEVFSLLDKENIEIATRVGISEKSVVAYRKKIKFKGFYFDPASLINWGELSRMLSGNRSVVTKNRMPKKHVQAVQELLEVIEKWNNAQK